MVPVIPDVSQVGKEAIVKKVLREFLHVYYDFIIIENRLVKYQNSFKSLEIFFQNIWFEDTTKDNKNKDIALFITKRINIKLLVDVSQAFEVLKLYFRDIDNKNIKINKIVPL